MAKAASPRLRRRERKNITSGVAHVNASFNNTMITITDAQGKDTTVMLFNVQQGVTFDPSVFAIDYSRVNRMARGDF